VIVDHLEIHAGMLMADRLRGLLKKYQSQGYDIEFSEEGLLSKAFIIEGSNRDLQQLKYLVSRLRNTLDGASP